MTHPPTPDQPDVASRREAPVVPSWSSPWEGLGLIMRGYTWRTGLLVSSVVGSLLSIVNQGATLMSGRAGLVTWLRIATNYVVPFFVSSIGYLAPSRQSRSRRVRAMARHSSLRRGVDEQRHGRDRAR